MSQTKTRAIHICSVCRVQRTGYDDPFHSRCDRLIEATPELLQTVTDLCDILDDYFRYAADMGKIGRGFSTVDTAGRVDENVVAGARALLAKIEGR